MNTADGAPAADDTPVPSPCINICHMDEATGWCEGCLRTLDEIATWSGLPEAGKREVLARLPVRREEWTRRMFVIHPEGPAR